jgi:hypothetical protein
LLAYEIDTAAVGVGVLVAGMGVLVGVGVLVAGMGVLVGVGVFVAGIGVLVSVGVAVGVKLDITLDAAEFICCEVIEFVSGVAMLCNT